jgi:hypothetical protein
MKPVKFNPTNVNEFENVDLESTPFEKQEKYASEDPLLEQLLSHRDINMNMKVQWSNLLKNYLITFTFLMFFTLWGARICLDLDPITLNFLITVGFAKVIGVVWIIVRHLFPTTK